ncbi:hypothetical protein D3C76_1693210 [compost metagenome]
MKVCSGIQRNNRTEEAYNKGLHKQGGIYQRIDIKRAAHPLQGPLYTVFEPD